MQFDQFKNVKIIEVRLESCGASMKDTVKDEAVRISLLCKADVLFTYNKDSYRIYYNDLMSVIHLVE